MNELVVKENKTRHYEGERKGLDLVEVGDWYWIKSDARKDYPEQKMKKDNERLFCVEHVGSNYIEFTRNNVYEYGSDGLHFESQNEYFRMHFKDFNKNCRREDNWAKHFSNRNKLIQQQIKEKTRLLLEAGKRLFLIRDHKANPVDTFLPAVTSVNPEKYKSDLIKFDNDTMPKIQREIKVLSTDFAVTCKNMAYSDMMKLGVATKSLHEIKDKIFEIELYVGLQELVKQITEGEPADLGEPICIRQQLLFMDEECLIDYDKGGMDFKGLDDFDAWVTRPDNLSRILPEQRSLVAFQVRRNPKDYGPCDSIAKAMRQIAKDHENMETYLLMRNGENVYRIASAINFSPRLVPFKNEIGEKQFKKVHREWGWHVEDDKITEEMIGPDNIEYDDHVDDLNDIIKKYNRIFIFLQGLLDRSQVFHPHPGIKLNRNDHMDLWIKCVRDEELGLPNNTITFEAYRDQLNKTIRKGKYIWSDFKSDVGRWYRDKLRYNKRESEIVNHPRICKVSAIKKDRSQIKITWEVETYRYTRWEIEEGTTNRHLWIPMDKVFNISGYTKGDYKMFLCDRALQGEYLKWAPQLLAAEKFNPIMQRRGKL